MTALLTDNLPLLAAAPNGIRKLRELILELAVRGKLLSQDPSDEPACELLKRIAEEKAELVAVGAIKKQKSLPEISEEETTFKLPQGWVWARLGNLATLITSGSRDWAQYYSEEGAIFVRMGNLSRQSYELRLANIQRVSPPEDGEGARTKLEAGDLLISITGEVGLLGLIPDGFGEAYINQHVCLLRFSSQLQGRFLPEALRSPFAYEQYEAPQRGVKNSFRLTDVSEMLVPLPPSAEQHRIVAKVDELMALCDRLEAQQADAESAHAQLVQALLDSLTQASDATDFATNWQRLAEHFHTLFTTEPSIDALKQTLLQLAVMGKLVPQDSSDEPAIQLLKRIAVEKARLEAGGKVRKQKPMLDVGEDEIAFEIPKSWEWTRLGGQVVESGAGWSPSCEPRPREGDEWGVLKVSAVSWGIYQPEENKALPASLEARPEHEVEEGDFLISRANTAELVARSVVVVTTPRNLMLSDKIVRLKLTSLCERRYVNLANSARMARDYYGLAAGGTSSSMKNVSREQILNLPIALPPLAEQHRIVAKIDQLMALCDQLKTRLTQARQLNEQLANTLVEQAVA